MTERYLLNLSAAFRPFTTGRTVTPARVRVLLGLLERCPSVMGQIPGGRRYLAQSVSPSPSISSQLNVIIRVGPKLYFLAL